MLNCCACGKIDYKTPSAARRALNGLRMRKHQSSTGATYSCEYGGWHYTRNGANRKITDQLFRPKPSQPLQLYQVRWNEY